MLNKNINNSGLFKKRKNTSARDMLSNMAGIRKPTGILAGSSELMQAVAMPQSQTGQGEIVTGALPGQFTTMSQPTMPQPVQRPQPMNMNEQRMNMARGPVTGMPNVQTQYNMGGYIQGYAPGGPVDVSQKAGSQGSTDPSKIPFSAAQRMGMRLLSGEEQLPMTPFNADNAGGDAEALNKKWQELSKQMASSATDTTKGKAILAAMGRSTEGNVNDDVKQLYQDMTGSKVPKKTKLDGAIQGIMGAATMKARGNDMQRIAAGLGAGSKAVYDIEVAKAGAKGSEYTRQRAYDRILEELVKGALDEDPEALSLPGALDQLKAQAAQLAGAVQPGGGSSAPAASSGLPSPKTKEEYDALKSGTQYLAPDGSTKTKG